jgi:hypothetical protein
VRADPEPSDLFALEKPKGTVSERHAHTPSAPVP